MKRQITALVSLLYFASPALAENWVAISRNPSNLPDARYAVDRDSLKKDGGIVSFWNAAFEPGPDGKQVKELAVHTAMDCKKRVYRQRTFINYDANGKVFSQTNPGDKAPWQTVTKGTLIDSIWDFVCR